MTPVALLWFKRDLRVHDHPALAHAARGEATVLPLFVVEPAYWQLDDTSWRQYGFLSESIGALREALGQLGAPLVIRVGEVREIFEAVRREYGIAEIVSHEETGNHWTYARDKALAAWARERGIPWTELAQCGVVRRLPDRDGWAKARDRHMRAPVLPPPMLRGAPVGETGRVPSPEDLGLVPDGIHTRQDGGRPAGEALLSSFLEARGLTYRRAMSSPVEGAEACSRLSPHIAFGTLSVREVVQATGTRQRAVRGTREGWGGSLKSFQARLAWRDHFIQKLEDEPGLEQRAMHSAYEDLRPREPDAARLQAWIAGETGLPFVDACMRSLVATGWLNFRMRAMLVAVASYHLWLDWRATGPHLARMFTDYEPGIHWPQMQMQSGTTGMNTVRIYNPVKQGHDQDPTGAFTRRWVPELADVPDAFVQTPWAWEGAGRLDYPPPIVDVAEAARDARERVWAVRRGAAFRDEAARVAKRHASRKDARFVNDRAPRRASGTAPDRGQLSLDL